jgi:signal transduction histidine kinase
VLIVFLGVALLSTGLLAALGWLLVRQDRELEETRRAERLAQAGDRLAIALQRAPDDRGLTAGSSPAHLTGTLTIVIETGRIAAASGDLLYYPYDPEPAFAEAPARVFEEAERLEYRAGDYEAAARAYSGLARNADVAIRAGALGRLARVERKRHGLDQARQAYDQLGAIEEPVAIEGFPATLYARIGRAGALAEGGHTDALHDEARGLQSDLRRSRWPLSKAQYLARQEEAGAWLGAEPAHDGERVAQAEAVEWLWLNRAALTSPGHRVLLLPDGPTLVAWLATGGALRAGVAGPESVSAMLADAGAEASSRHMLLLAALSAIGLVLLAGWYFILRALARERRTARLQADFVAAVSHEFRSPLTSMAHLAEMLEADRLPSDETRRTSYGMLVRDTHRLRRLVEDLLDFRRLEAGAAALRLEPVDLVELVSAVAADFQAQAIPPGYRVDVRMPEAPVGLAADRDALARALWNLLDNAVKYSPECRTVWVDLRRDGECVAISVRDEGLGIPADEQRRVFDRFVRGAQAKRLRIKGTGIGLAIVRHVARSHGGDVRLASEPGRGSRFTILLPAPVSAGAARSRREPGPEARAAS